MILTKEEVQNRLDSPLNLRNRLRQGSSKQESLAVLTGEIVEQRADIVSLPPSADSLIDDLESKLKNPKATANEILTKSLDAINHNIERIDIRQLPSLAVNMARIIESENERGNSGPKMIVIHKPVMIQENHYETINVNE